jgi:two-component system, NtrC family, response regulator AtoC
MGRSEVDGDLTSALAGSVALVGEHPEILKYIEQIAQKSQLTFQRFATVASLGNCLQEGKAELVVFPLPSSVADVQRDLRDLANKALGEVPIVVIADNDQLSQELLLSWGASDVLVVPVTEQELLFALKKAIHLGDQLQVSPPAGALGMMVGESKVMLRLRSLIERASPGIATVLVRGETGTGKELVARAIHDNSERANQPYVKVHCAALPDALLESELFGYERGAFTGAVSRKLGRVEVAQGGTLFLDEIGDITPAIQVKLLRLLQDRKFERLGSTTSLDANVRFVAATHRDLESMVKRGEFREDLFYRLNVIPIWVPPLRARRNDLQRLAKTFVERMAISNGRPGMKISEEAADWVAQQRWPGNVRQLQNFIERLVVLCPHTEIGVRDVQGELAENTQFQTQFPTQAGTPSAPSVISKVIPLEEEMRATERKAIERALRHAKGNRSLAARLLGVSRATLYNKLEEYQLS